MVFCYSSPSGLKRHLVLRVETRNSWPGPSIRHVPSLETRVFTGKMGISSHGPKGGAVRAKEIVGERTLVHPAHQLLTNGTDSVNYTEDVRMTSL